MRSGKGLQEFPCEPPCSSGPIADRYITTASCSEQAVGASQASQFIDVANLDRDHCEWKKRTLWLGVEPSFRAALVR
jgi:hypothetical protein